MRAPMRMSMAARSIWRDSLSTLLAGALAVAAGAAAVPGSAAAVATEVLMRVSRKAQISKEDDDPAAAGPPQGGWGPLWGAEPCGSRLACAGLDRVKSVRVSRSPVRPHAVRERGGSQDLGQAACHEDVGVQLVGGFVADLLLGVVVGEQAPDEFVVDAEACQQGVARGELHDLGGGEGREDVGGLFVEAEAEVGFADLGKHLFAGHGQTPLYGAAVAASCRVSRSVEMDCEDPVKEN